MDHLFVQQAGHEDIQRSICAKGTQVNVLAIIKARSP